MSRHEVFSLVIVHCVDQEKCSVPRLDLDGSL